MADSTSSIAALDGLFGGGRVDALFRRRTQIPVGAEAAMKAGLGIELPLGNISGNLLHFHLRFLELQVRARGRNRSIVFEVVEEQTLRFVSPTFLRSERINGKLKTL